MNNLAWKQTRFEKIRKFYWCCTVKDSIYFYFMTGKSEPAIFDDKPSRSSSEESDNTKASTAMKPGLSILNIVESWPK